MKKAIKISISIIIIVITLILFVTAFYLYNTKIIHNIEPQTSLKINNNQLMDVTLEINAPFSKARIMISGSGENLVTYWAKWTRGSNKDKEINDSKKISQKQIAELMTLLERNGFYKMENRPYIPESLTDGSNYAITVRTLPEGLVELVDPGINSVKCYEFNCESRFIEIKNKIQELWGKDVIEIGV